MTNCRKARGAKTQALLAARWRERGLFPYATDAGAGRQGSDVLNTPGFAIEVKATTTQSLQAGLRQAEAGGRGIPALIWRHNGQGEAQMDEWTVTLRLRDFEELVRCRQMTWGESVQP